MPPTTAYSFGEVVLHAQRRNLVIMAITRQIPPRPAFGQGTVTD
jgi:hypothetical protein